jgi:hypothetical protein
MYGGVSTSLPRQLDSGEHDHAHHHEKQDARYDPLKSVEVREQGIASPA